MQPQVIHSTSK